jgi:hypothetical protein
MDDEDVLTRIQSLMDEEQHLRQGQGDGGPPLGRQEQERLRNLEVSLDQCWDLLRRRRAREEFGQNPDAEDAQPETTVEGYLQ